MKHTVILLLFTMTVYGSFSQPSLHLHSSSLIGVGGVPSLKKDGSNGLHLIYGNKDSILYIYSADGGKSFKPAQLVDIVPGLFSYAMRGPQIAVANDNVIVTATTKDGDIYYFSKHISSPTWSKGSRLNDVKGVAAEGLMCLAADKSNVFAAWLDTRGGDKGQRLYAARSADGGKNWTNDFLIYASPDSTICECCKPSIAMKNKNVYVMFRNWIDGDRDLYLISSRDGGRKFGKAQQLGDGHWKLDGCPMDGGGLTVNSKGEVNTVWRRNSTIYAATPGKTETKVGEGKICTITSVNRRNVYAWVQNGEVVITTSDNKIIQLGKGMVPVLEPVNNNMIACAWENEKQVYFALISL